MKISGAQQHRIGQRKRRQQPRAAEHQPGLVAVPHRRHGVHHDVAVMPQRHEGIQHADAEVEAVHHDIHHHAEENDHGPDQWKIDTHA
jgi:hypothetical protein